MSRAATSAPPARLPVIALVLASVLWGTTGTAASFFPAGVSPLAVGAVTMAFGGLLLVVVSLRRSVAVLRDSAARRWVLIGTIGVVAYPLAFYSAMNLAGVAIGNVVALGSGPVFAAIIEWLVERHRPTRRWAVSTLVAIVGIALLSVLGRQVTDVGDRLLPGVALGLVAGLAYALYAYASSRALAAGHSGRGVMGAMFGAGAIPLLLVMAVVGAPLLQSGRTVGIAAYLVIVPMFLAYLLFGIGLRGVRSSAATTITLVEPLVATVLAVTVVGERLTLPGWLGLLLILGGVTAMATARQPRANPAAP
ncbi:DMT family transporter [Lacisediminihabitans changchengi]|uniref:EamA family transporter n=1 Tax=Lacisediminihabitans changchengi TaxID=2787634 RepID=A0A934W2C1_9MICO|nr:EamA family transporter [Lacisediminihabitans changchengi]MBK4346681.1 EamA family transporter [Lacisediminihabitans changchengi]